MAERQLATGLKIKVTSLKPIDGIHVDHEYILRRKLNKQGILIQHLPGYGGDVWFVQQKDGVAIYRIDEFKSV